MLRQKHRLHYIPNTRGDTNFEDVFLHSIDENDVYDHPAKPGCMPPFVTRFIEWISFWKRKEPSRPKSICDIDEMV
jgi:hypothetical protein